ncbi:bacteriophage DNA transposition B protein, putative [Desulfarculus baarsii DSM 2075]|uniref:Bacteriophage DNA transposition B protein, putative n=1 Tax=Desulfarculus baarsii (strain ATCC 33931 / DSM 2075 / LMG 7858 / VKM B-1802 / 2st14) TaxID=644282 RepID=E1QHD3_DESB2|nr:ATP-binding protein [Desulfarculus baarsii]ADK84976.1 bacteriophage DNA transposition B protein, putative [Desulfarculus baarsii DSM 2075]
MKKGVFVETSNVTRFRAAVAQARDFERGRPGMLMAWGEAGRGKTICAMNAFAEGGGVYLRAWEGWSQSAFLQALCFEITGLRPRGSNRSKVAIIQALDPEPRAIYIDEADRLALGRLEDLRDIHDETGCPVVLIGEEGLAAKLSARRRIDDRIPAEFRIRFEPVTCQDISLYAMEAADLRLTPEASKFVHGLTRGNFRRVHNAMLSLEQMARAAEVDIIDQAMARRLGGK